ncbi:hypothetical protein HK102_000730 [Quaeritorhiza haematococci]|nr:hypothetical protein HK102_000730 [Quaeritorhiza haematococci]
MAITQDIPIALACSILWGITFSIVFTNIIRTWSLFVNKKSLMFAILMINCYVCFNEPLMKLFDFFYGDEVDHKALPILIGSHWLVMVQTTLHLQVNRYKIFKGTSTTFLDKTILSLPWLLLLIQIPDAILYAYGSIVPSIWPIFDKFQTAVLVCELIADLLINGMLIYRLRMNAMANEALHRKNRSNEQHEIAMRVLAGTVILNIAIVVMANIHRNETVLPMLILKSIMYSLRTYAVIDLLDEIVQEKREQVGQRASVRKSLGNAANVSSTTDGGASAPWSEGSFLSASLSRTGVDRSHQW